jgi:hypothetical protein
MWRFAHYSKRQSGMAVMNIIFSRFKEEKHHGNGSKEQHVGNLDPEHVEQEQQRSFQEPGESIFRYEDQRRSR